MEQSCIILSMDLLLDKCSLYSITPFCGGCWLLEVLEYKNCFLEPEARHWMW